MQADTQHLKRRGHAWWFKLKIPAAIRDCYGGKEHIELSLATRDVGDPNSATVCRSHRPASLTVREMGQFTYLSAT
jgi:hypothetical protein